MHFIRPHFSTLLLISPFIGQCLGPDLVGYGNLSRSSEYGASACRNLFSTLPYRLGHQIRFSSRNINVGSAFSSIEKNCKAPDHVIIALTYRYAEMIAASQPIDAPLKASVISMAGASNGKVKLLS